MGNPIRQLLSTRQAPGDVRQYLSDSRAAALVWNSAVPDDTEKYLDAFKAGWKDTSRRPVLETIRPEADQFHTLGTQYKGASATNKLLPQRQKSFANLITLLLVVGIPLTAFAVVGLSSRGFEPSFLHGAAGAMQKVPLAAPIVAGALGGLSLTGAIGLNIAKNREKQLHANFNNYAITPDSLRFRGTSGGVTYV